MYIFQFVCILLTLCGIKKIQKINMYAVQSGKRSKTFP